MRVGFALVVGATIDLVFGVINWTCYNVSIATLTGLLTRPELRLSWSTSVLASWLGLDSNVNDKATGMELMHLLEHTYT